MKAWPEVGKVSRSRRRSRWPSTTAPWFVPEFSPKNLSTCSARKRVSSDRNESMARGWQSKSVEAQIEMAEHHSAMVRARALSEESLDLLRKKESILRSE